jgi:hypothetical protein
MTVTANMIAVVQAQLLALTCIPHELSPYWLKGIARSWRSGSPSPPLRILGELYATVACCVGKSKSLLVKRAAALSFVNASAYSGVAAKEAAASLGNSNASAWGGQHDRNSNETAGLAQRRAHGAVILF